MSIRSLRRITTPSSIPAPDVTTSLFADTSALLAIFIPREEHHVEARRIYQAARAAGRPILSSTDVFNELVTLLRKRAGAEAAVRVGDALLQGAIRFVSVGADIRARAWALFKAHRWPGLSMTDCGSSAIVTSHRIPEVFTFDDDFRKLGHDTLPAPKPLLKPRRPRHG